MKKHRVVVINPWYTPYRIPVLREVALKGEFDVTVIFCTPLEPGREWTLPSDLPFKAVFLTSISLYSYSNRNVFGEQVTFRYPNQLLSTLTSIKPDIIVELEFRLDCIMALTYALIHQCGYVTWSDMTLIHDQRMGSVRLLIRRLLLSRSKALIASCSDTKSYFNQVYSYPEEKIFISILGSHVGDHIAQSGITPKKAEDIRESDHVRFLYVGKLIPLKGVDLLISAFAQLFTWRKKVQLTIVGDGIDRYAIQKKAEEFGCADHIVFKGHIPYHQIPNEMVLHDVFVFPTLLDVFGLVVAEAAACGLPVICSCFAGAANDLVKDNGVIINPYDTIAFAGAMEYLMSADVRRKMTKACRQITSLLNLNSAAESFCQALRVGIQQRR